jgi:hypothetical protein
MAATPAHNPQKPANSPSGGSGGFKSSPGPVFGTLEHVFEDIWWAWGTVRFAPGIIFPRNMTIVREGDGLVVIHPVLMPPAVQAQIEALGPIRHIVRLGAFHGMDDPTYVKRYSPTVWAPAGADLRDGVTVHHELREGAPVPFADGTLLAFQRSRTPETVIRLARHGGLLLTCDSVQNWETSAGCSFLGGLMARVMGFRGRACIGPGWRKMSEPKDGRGFADDFERLLALEFRHVLSGHGQPMKDSAKQDLTGRVRRLYPKS